MSEKYSPSNGSEGECFMDRFCFQCERDAKYQETGDGQYGCRIVADTLIYDVEDQRYPTEWTYDANGKPTCTAFVPLGEPVKERCKHTADMFESEAEQQ